MTVQRELDDKTIGKHVRAWRGVYMLYVRKGGVPHWVGRADNLYTRLMSHAREGVYKWFRFEYVGAARTAFCRECNLYHRHIENLDNTYHPRRPDGTNWRCPRCSVFD